MFGRLPHHYPEPRISQILFASRGAAVFWLVVRLYVGWQWLVAGWHKVRDPVWVGPDAGAAVSGYLNGALGRAGGEQPTVTGWYAYLIEHLFLPNAALLSNVVAIGEVIVGVTLILGLLTGASAFFGGLMNTTYLLAGTLSSNPVLFILATWLVLAWRVAGYIGLDYWVLPWLGAPRRHAAPGTGPTEERAT